MLQTAEVQRREICKEYTSNLAASLCLPIFLDEPLGLYDSLVSVMNLVCVYQPTNSSLTVVNNLPSTSSKFRGKSVYNIYFIPI